MNRNRPERAPNVSNWGRARSSSGHRGPGPARPRDRGYRWSPGWGGSVGTDTASLLQGREATRQLTATPSLTPSRFCGPNRRPEGEALEPLIAMPPSSRRRDVFRVPDHRTRTRLPLLPHARPRPRGLPRDAVALMVRKPVDHGQADALTISLVWHLETGVTDVPVRSTSRRVRRSIPNSARSSGRSRRTARTLSSPGRTQPRSLRRARAVSSAAQVLIPIVPGQKLRRVHHEGRRAHDRFSCHADRSDLVGCRRQGPGLDLDHLDHALSRRASRDDRSGRRRYLRHHRTAGTRGSLGKSSPQHRGRTGQRQTCDGTNWT